VPAKRRPRRSETTFFDQRRRPARRFREICDAYAREAGGEITDLERDIIKQAAALTYRGEELLGSDAPRRPGGQR
jgi:hypothetical protein